MKTIVYVGTSLDGFIARTDGEFDWLSQFANDEAIRAYKEYDGSAVKYQGESNHSLHGSPSAVKLSFRHGLFDYLC